MDQNHVVGTIFGAVIGVYKATIAFIGMLTTLGYIVWTDALYHIGLALICGAAGWCGAEIMKWVKKLYSNRKKR